MLLRTEKVDQRAVRTGIATVFAMAIGLCSVFVGLLGWILWALPWGRDHGVWSLREVVWISSAVVTALSGICFATCVVLHVPRARVALGAWLGAVGLLLVATVGGNVSLAAAGDVLIACVVVAILARGALIEHAGPQSNER